MINLFLLLHRELGFIFKVAVICFVMLSFFWLAAIGWWLFEPVTPITQFISQDPVDARGKPKTEFRPGDDLFYVRKGAVLRKVSRTLHAHLFNDDTNTVYVRLPVSAGIVPGSGPFTLTYKAMTLPTDLPPGNYSFRVSIYYQLNWLRGTVIEESPPVKFKVVAK